MLGIIELHGGKLIIKTETITISTVSTSVMPGDTVTVPEGTLVHRIEQPGIAIVKRIDHDKAFLWISTIFPCAFEPSVPSDGLSIGMRLIIWFNANGSIHILHICSLDANDDAECIYRAYCATNMIPTFCNTTPGPVLYTQNNRVDHSTLDTFTIDPKHSVDFDDAISVDTDKNIIYVHIVDIAHVPLTTEECERLRRRCFTLYLANEQTEHVLDKENASYNLSLIVGQMRNTITVKMTVNAGMITAYDIYPSIICVTRRYTYEEVLMGLKNGTASMAIQYLNQLSLEREANVLYHLYLPAQRFTIQDGIINEIHQEDHDESHQLVATAMIMTNVVVSTHLAKCGVIFPNRFHETLRGVNRYSNRALTGNSQVDSFMMVKTYARAQYAVDEKGHFGLQVTDYVHFTSPMRRYADVIVHRILAGECYDYDTLVKEVDWINTRSALCRTLQHLYTTWKIGRHIQMVSTTHIIWITGISRAGVIWYLPQFSLNGFAHVTMLEPKQFWKWEDGVLKGKTEEIRVGRSYTVSQLQVNPITFEASIKIFIK
jgi:exoribonuclease R